MQKLALSLVLMVVTFQTHAMEEDSPRSPIQNSTGMEQDSPRSPRKDTPRPARKEYHETLKEAQEAMAMAEDALIQTTREKRRQSKQMETTTEARAVKNINQQNN